MKFLGEKTKHFYNQFLKRHLPENLEEYIYVEPFGGSFAVSKYLEKRPKELIYNDIQDYNLLIIADKIHHTDYIEIFEIYDSENTFFYLDPPYYRKEHLYDYKNSNNFHVELRDNISKLKSKFILSYEDCKYIRELYKDFNIIKYDGNRFELRNEILILK